MTDQSKPLHAHPSFSELVTDLADGQVDQHLTSELSRIAEAVHDTGKVGELTVKLKLKRERGMVLVHVESNAKLPQEALHATLFHVGLNGALLREDPRQQKLKNIDPPRMVRPEGDL